MSIEKRTHNIKKENYLIIWFNFMRAVKNSILVNSNLEKAFTISQDYSLRSSWDPFIIEYKILSAELPLSRGYIVYVKSKHAMSMTVEYTNYNKPNHVAMKMISKSIYFRHFSGYWHFESFEKNQTTVTFKYQYSLQNFLIPCTWLFHYFMNKEMKKRLIALKEYIEQVDDIKLL
jgi:ribosome-associated toxin RatA of RatAB toxin-antitoxin module